MPCCHSQSPASCYAKIATAVVVGGVIAGFAYAVYRYRNKTKKPIRPKGFLSDKSETKQVELLERREITHDVRLFRFGLPEGEVLGLLPGEHVKLVAEIDGKKISRFYSPVSSPTQTGHFDIVIKVYSKTEENPNGGVFSRYLDSLTPGTNVNISGPFGRFGYIEKGDFLVNQTATTNYKTIAMIAGGSGLTPMVQLMRQVLAEKENSHKAPNIALIYSNKTEQDVILEDELKRYAHEHNGHFSLALAFTRLKDSLAEKVGSKWTEHEGRINEGLLSQVFPFPAEDVLVLICGPKGLNDHAKTLASSLGYSHVHTF